MRLTRVAFSLVFLFISTVLFAVPVSAQGVNDFTINRFLVAYKLDNTDLQGRLQITETIELDFSGQNRGILRAIPAVYGNEPTNPVIRRVERDGASERFETYDENSNMVVRIGDPNVYITGPHTYTISYEVENVIRFYDTHDELYWDINGDGWMQPFLEVSGDVQSAAIVQDSLEPLCYTGVFGANEQNCTIETQGDTVSFATTEQLYPYETLSILVAYDKGYFLPPTWLEKHTEDLIAGGVVVFQAWLFWRIYRKWRIDGKDYAERGVTVPYYDRPKNVSVMQAAYVAQNSLTSKVISASIIDLAIRGYINIQENTNKKKITHDLELMHPADSQVSSDEKMLLDSLFTSGIAGELISIEKQKNKMFNLVSRLATEIDTRALSNGLYEVSPLKSSSTFGRYYGIGFLGLAVGVAVGLLTNIIPLVTGVVLFFMTLVLGGLMSRRTQAGILLKEHVEGIKLFLEVAEKDRIKQQDTVAAPLAPHTGQPVRDVKFFEKLLPFAIVFGLEKTWAKAFEDIYVQPPDWYHGNYSTFNAATFASSLASTTSAVGSVFTAPASSSGSGFSGGGGSAGGGGGGGGGGGW